MWNFYWIGAHNTILSNGGVTRREFTIGEFLVPPQQANLGPQPGSRSRPLPVPEEPIPHILFEYIVSLPHSSLIQIQYNLIHCVGKNI